ESAASRCSIGQLPPLGEGLQTDGQLAVVWRGAQHGPERPANEQRVARLVCRQTVRNPLRGVEDDRAVGQGQRLLRDDALVAPVSSRQGSLVEGSQKLVPLVVGVEKVDTATVGVRLTRHRRSALSKVEHAGQQTNRVPYRLRFEANGWPPPPVDVIRIASHV